MLTECSEFDTKGSTGHSWGLTTPEERGSATHDKYPPSGTVQREEGGIKRQANDCGKTQIDDGLRLSKTIANASGPSRPCEMSTERPVLATARAKTFNDGNSMNQSNVFQNRPFLNGSVVGRSCARAKSNTNSSSLHPSNSSKNEIDKKLEIAKRKLHQGYQQAENAKKQRTVQILNSLDLPFSSQSGKARMNTNVHNKELLVSRDEARAKVNVHVQIKEVMGAKMNVPVHDKAPFKNS
ncbi:hypothetical protein L7F22_031050 [Adiantum nelumboides]|nr:hypothetical protein [Adiantum nelumboides]